MTIEDMENELITLECDVLPDLQDSLNQLTSPDYNPNNDPDGEYEEQDTEYLTREISKVNSRIYYLKCCLRRKPNDD